MYVELYNNYDNNIIILCAWKNIIMELTKIKFTKKAIMNLSFNNDAL